MNTSRKANTIKDLQGTFRKDRDGKSQDQMRGEVLDKLPSAPRRLSISGKKAWQEIGKVVVKTRSLQDLDLALFEQLANVCGWIRDLEEQINDSPKPFAPTSERLAYEKNRKKWLADYERLLKIFTDQCRLFGLTPSTRSQVQPPLAGRQLSITDIIRGGK